MGKKVLLAVVTGASLLNFSAGALDQSAPFGLSWGPVNKVPRPSLATRDENITRLTYFRDRLPPNFRETEEIVLEVLFVAATPFFVARRVQLTQLAAFHRLPAAYPLRDFAEAGGLMSYGASIADAYHQVGIYTGRILKGA